MPDDIPWDRFDPTKVDPEMLRIVKAAAMVEFNGNIYADYLCNVFNDDPDFQDAARRWSLEEVQHGEVLARWARMADPEFDFETRFADENRRHVWRGHSSFSEKIRVFTGRISSGRCKWIDIRYERRVMRRADIFVGRLGRERERYGSVESTGSWGDQRSVG